MSEDETEPLPPPTGYLGPYVAAVSSDPAERWVWVANGQYGDMDMFASPIADDPYLAPVRGPVAVERWKARQAAVIEKLKSEGLWVENLVTQKNRHHDVPVEAGIVEPVDPIAPDGVEQRSGAFVRLLGPVPEVAGWLETPGRAVVTELLCFLVMHRGRSISGDELRLALWPNVSQEASAKTLRTYMSQLRKSLGKDLVPLGTATGYLISEGVVTDWERFVALSRPGAEIAQLAQALELIRGRPFSGVPADTYGWVFSESFVSDMEVAIVAAVRRLVQDALARRELSMAMSATRQGLLAVPTDYQLWSDHLVVARAQGSGEFERARRDMLAALGADAQELLEEPAPRPTDES